MTALRRILLVENDPNDVKLALRALAAHNLAQAVDVAPDGEQALDYLQRRGTYAQRPAGDPVVVIMDIKMPKVDGLEALRRIKGDPVLRTLPVVLLTSSREERDLAAAYDLGVNAYVVKPVDFELFMETIRRLGLFWAVINEPPAPQPETRFEATVNSPE